MSRDIEMLNDEFVGPPTQNQYLKTVMDLHVVDHGQTFLDFVKLLLDI